MRNQRIMNVIAADWKLEASVHTVSYSSLGAYHITSLRLSFPFCQISGLYHFFLIYSLSIYWPSIGEDAGYLGKMITIFPPALLNWAKTLCLTLSHLILTANLGGVSDQSVPSLQGWR